jgi:competence protein ComGC
MATLFQKDVTPLKLKDYSTASLVLGIISLLTVIFWFISVVLGVLAIVFGAISTKTPGRGKAIAGIILGSIGIVLSFAIIVVIFTAIPALQKNTRDTARKNDAAIIASRINQYQSSNNGQLPAASSLSTSGLVQISSITSEGPQTKDSVVYVTGKNCDGVASTHNYSIYIMSENSTITCIGS